MSFETAVIGRMLGDAAITAKAGTRVDLLRRPGRVLPAITAQVISDPRLQHLKGWQLRRTRVQIDVWAASPAVAIELRERAITVLAPGGTFGDVRFDHATGISVRSAMGDQEIATDGQPQGELYRESIDIIFIHRG